MGSETNNTLITIITSIILRSRRWGVSAPAAANTVSCLEIYKATKSDCRPISFHLLPPFTFMICLLGTHVCKRPLIVCGLIIEPICQSPFKLVQSLSSFSSHSHVLLDEGDEGELHQRNDASRNGGNPSAAMIKSELLDGCSRVTPVCDGKRAEPFPPPSLNERTSRPDKSSLSKRFMRSSLPLPRSKLHI